MKSLFLLAAFGLISSISHAARPLEFRLACEVDSHAPANVRALRNISLVKKPFRTQAGSWDNRYSIEATGLRIELTPAFSGDEDYNEYRIVGSNELDITGAAIQNRFQWASILVGGSSVIDCR